MAGTAAKLKGPFYEAGLEELSKTKGTERGCYLQTSGGVNTREASDWALEEDRAQLERGVRSGRRGRRKACVSQGPVAGLSGKRSLKIEGQKIKKFREGSVPSSAGAALHLVGLFPFSRGYAWLAFYPKAGLNVGTAEQAEISLALDPLCAKISWKKSQRSTSLVKLELLLKQGFLFCWLWLQSSIHSEVKRV